jgi:N6-adenosine-specific RNA methylase IME4
MPKNELVSRLRHMAKLVGFGLGNLLNEAADEIERSEKERENQLSPQLFVEKIS